ncbi:PIN domain-containing protein [Kyrpidia tusciae]|uniref:PIN domain-containing protein n=1 Tax=Kyrpidia tusciae TaxID=33943 RepID=UPI00145D5C16|nr:PIN domain-containing protein [Kyrpidia tusciae]
MTRSVLPIAVVDASVLVSNSNREHLVTAAYEGLYRPIWSPWIIAELNRALTWNWIRNKGGLRERTQLSKRYNDMMSFLASVFDCVDPKPPWYPAWPKLADENDLPISSTAKFADADYIVSANVREFPPQNDEGKHVWEGVEYITAPDFFKRIGYEC